MNKFTLSQLRADVEAHTDFFDDAVIDGLSVKIPGLTADWFLIQLIGRSEFNLLLANPVALVEFIPVNQDTQIVLRLS